MAVGVQKSVFVSQLEPLWAAIVYSTAQLQSLKNKLATFEQTIMLAHRKHQWHRHILQDHVPCPVVKISPSLCMDECSVLWWFLTACLWTLYSREWHSTRKQEQYWAIKIIRSQWEMSRRHSKMYKQLAGCKGFSHWLILICVSDSLCSKNRMRIRSQVNKIGIRKMEKCANFSHNGS